MTNLLRSLLGVLISLSFALAAPQTTPSRLDSQQRNNLMVVLRLCWALRENIQFLDRKFTFNLSTFKERQDYDIQLFSTYESSLIPAKPLEFSIPHPNEININRINALIHQVYYDKPRFQASLAQPRREYFVAKSGLTAAHLTTLHDHVEGLQMLLSSFPEISQITIKSSGTTPLHFAVTNRAYHCIKLLLKSGASPFTADNVGNTPLDLVFLKGDIEALLLFLVYGKILNHPALKQSSGVALESGLLQLCAKLILAGAESELTSENGQENILFLLLKQGHFDHFNLLRPLFPANQDLLLFVIREGINEAIKLFSLNQLRKPVSASQRTLLHYAFDVDNAEAFKELVQLVPLFAKMNHTTPELQLIALKAIQSGNASFLKTMMECFPTLRPWSMNNGASLLVHALLNNQFRVAEMMMETYNPYLSRCKFNGFPIHEHALLTHNTPFYAFLIQHGLEPNSILSSGMSALNFAIKTLDLPLTTLILSYGPNLVQPDAYGVVPLMLLLTSPLPQMRAMIQSK